MLLTGQEGSGYACVEGWDEAKSEKHEHDKMVEKAETDEGWVRVDTALDQLPKSRKNGPVEASHVAIKITTNRNAGSSGIYGNAPSEPAVNTLWNQSHE